MRLPNVDTAIVPWEKVSDYLLSLTHRNGRHKAAFFLSFGFSANAWRELVEALLKHTQSRIEMPRVKRDSIRRVFVLSFTILGVLIFLELNYLSRCGRQR